MYCTLCILYVLLLRERIVLTLVLDLFQVNTLSYDIFTKCLVQGILILINALEVDH